MKSDLRRNCIMILVNSKKQMLFQLRDNKPGITYPGYWGMFGGGIEEGETELESIKREVNEEINQDIKNPKKFGEIYIKRLNMQLYVFIAKFDKKIDEIKINEGQRAEYFSFEDFDNLKIPYHLKKFLIKNKQEILKI